MSLDSVQPVEPSEVSGSVTPPPQAEPARWRSLALAVLVHALLVGALFLGVQWKSKTPTAVEVEVWRAAPAPVVTPPPPPEPEQKPEPEPKPPVKPDIALPEEKKPKKEEPRKPEPKKEEPKKPEPKKEEPKKPEPERRTSFDEELKRDQKQLEQQKNLQDQRARAEAEARQLNQLKADQAAAARARGLASYLDKIRGKVRGNIVLPPGIQGNPEAIFEIAQLPSGEVIGNPKLVKSSGNPLLDAAIERAILKSSPLPKPDQPELFDRVLKMKFRPQEE